MRKAEAARAVAKKRRVDGEVIDLCKSDNDGASNQPNTKKPKPSASELKKKELEKDFARTKREIESRYEKEIKQLEDNRSIEIDELAKKHNLAIQELKQHELREKAGTIGVDVACGTCGQELSKENLDSKNYFDCEKCGDKHCIDHKDDDAQECIVCNKTYCESCVKTIVKCNGCTLCPQLTCCTLVKMPCGQYECSSGDCDSYHHKYCRCERR